MADLLEIIKGRRSIRKYETRDVTDAMVDQVLEAIRWAPSWTNCQCWEVVVVRDPAIKAQLQATLPPSGNPAARAIVQAPVLLALCAKNWNFGLLQGYSDYQVWRLDDV